MRRQIRGGLDAAVAGWVWGGGGSVSPASVRWKPSVPRKQRTNEASQVTPVAKNPPVNAGDIKDVV